VTETVPAAPARTTTTEDFKAGFRHHAAGVALVVADTPAGPVGLTVSSLASVSADPPMLSFSVASTRGSARALLQAPALDVVLLSAAHAPLAAAFATPGAPRFTAEQGWLRFPLRLADARATFHGRIAETVAAGDSRLVLVEVTGVDLGEPAEPLVYVDRAYRTLV